MVHYLQPLRRLLMNSCLKPKKGKRRTLKDGLPSVERLEVVGQIHSSEVMTFKLKSLMTGSPTSIISVAKVRAQLQFVLVEVLKGSGINMNSLMILMIVTGEQRKRVLLVQSEVNVIFRMFVIEVTKGINLKKEMIMIQVSLKIINYSMISDKQIKFLKCRQTVIV
jgi:hypothetical protein